MEVHEFLADKNTIKQVGKEGYQEYILSMINQKLQPNLAHNFNSIIKTRLAMMNSKSKPHKWSYLVVLAVFSFSVFLFSCHTKRPIEEYVLTNRGPVKVTIETRIDTVITFDAETFEEKITYHENVYRYFSDTIIRIDPKTNKEYVEIMKNYVLPEDLMKN